MDSLQVIGGPDAFICNNVLKLLTTALIEYKTGTNL